MSTHERRKEILERMKSDPFAQIVLARRMSLKPISRPALAKPEAGDPKTEKIVAEISRRDKAPSINQLTTALTGRLVRAGEANLNGAFFSDSDLQFGLSSLAGAPFTWNHDSELGAYGWIEEASLVQSPDHGTHTLIAGRAWTGRFPEFALSLDKSLSDGTASLSMECMASAVGCMAEGCDCVASEAGDACDHILQHTASRRMIDPTFFGAAILTDGVKPGWPGASLTYR